MEFKEIKIAWEAEFPNVGIKTQVSRLLNRVAAVHIGVAEHGIVAGNSYPDIIGDLFTKENTGSCFGPVERWIGVQIAKIMTKTNRNSHFTLVNIGFQQLRLGPVQPHEHAEE